MARFIALVYNWWNVFVRLAGPDGRLEAITSRPLLLSAIAGRTYHARQTTLKVASSHAKAGWAASMLSGIARKRPAVLPGGFEWHYTPRHGSCAGQCLDRRTDQRLA